jgi:hypothetical protein
LWGSDNGWRGGDEGSGFGIRAGGSSRSDIKKEKREKKKEKIKTEFCRGCGTTVFAFTVFYAANDGGGLTVMCDGRNYIIFVDEDDWM